MVAETRRRLFFALWPPASVLDRIEQATFGLPKDGRPTARHQWHVTLAFHGNCDAWQHRQLIERAGSRQWPTIALSFDRLGYFSRPRIAWLGMSWVPTILCELAAHLAGAGLEAGRFVPHITVRRGCSPVDTGSVVPIGWQAREFTLVESGTHGAPGRYRILARWPLARANVE